MANKLKTILIVDDELDLLQLLSLNLQQRGYVTYTAQNGVEALEKLQTITPDLIILDLNMPKMGGIEFYQNICEGDVPKFPVFVLTARANMEQLFKDFNVEGFVAKPIDNEKLFSEIDIVIKKKSGEAFKIKEDARHTLLKTVTIIEDDAPRLKELVNLFTDAGYKVDSALSATEGIEKLVDNPTTIALTKLNLEGITGDVIVLRLQQMPKTMEIANVLYIDRNYEQNYSDSVMQTLRQKSGVVRVLDYSKPVELLEAVNDVINKF